MSSLAKRIEGFEYYIINREGKVWSFYNGITILKQPISNTGYPTVTLYKNGKYHKRLVHRLLAIAFIPNPDKLPIVLHKDNNKLNYSLENLKWGTQSENTKQSYNDNRREAPKNMLGIKGILNKRAKKIKCVNLLTNDVTYFYGLNEVSSKLNLSNGNINACCLGKRKRVSHYTFSYEE